MVILSVPSFQILQKDSPYFDNVGKSPKILSLRYKFLREQNSIEAFYTWSPFITENVLGSRCYEIAGDEVPGLCLLRVATQAQVQGDWNAGANSCFGWLHIWGWGRGCNKTINHLIPLHFLPFKGLKTSWHFSWEK